MASILISNDDGYAAQGIKWLREILVEMGHHTRVIAPRRDMSGMSGSITLGRRIKSELLANQDVIVDGTPTDCVLLGATGEFGGQYDRVISGINNAFNMGWCNYCFAFFLLFLHIFKKSN